MTTSIWQGSTTTLSMVARQIAERWGADEVAHYDPRANCFTFNGWKERGYMVKKGEHGMRSVTFVPYEKKKKNGEIETGAYPRTVVLFYEKQVEKIKN